MSGEVTATAIEALFKEQFGEGPINVIPEVSILQKLVTFKTGMSVGKKFQFPVILKNESGFTRLAAKGGITSLNSGSAMAMDLCEFDGYQKWLRSPIEDEAIYKGLNNKKAFKTTVGTVLENMNNSVRIELEEDMLYGQSGLAKTQVSGTSGTTTTETLKITAASWTAGLWNGKEGTTIQFYNSTALVSSGADSVFTITQIDVDNKTIKVSGSAAGIAALDSAAKATGASLTLYKYGAYGNEMAGLDKIITNTGSLFGIDAGTYSMWKGNSFAVSGVITPKKLLRACALATVRGLMGRATCILNSEVYAELSDTLSGYIRYYADDKAKYGFEAIELKGPNGPLSVVSHPMVKTGDGFIFPSDQLVRSGATDVTFKGPNQYSYVEKVNGTNYSEIVAYSHQAILCRKPAACVKLTGITLS